MELEVKRKEIADVVRARIVVDKNVAEEEEKIKDLRSRSEADRLAEVQVIAAKAEAEESLVKSIKQAEAQEKVAEHKAREQLVKADADLQAADRVAQAKIRIAEGVQAEEAASGLAAVRVKEANAAALEKEGEAEAKVQLQRLQAQARGEEDQGMARNRVREKDVELDARAGEVDATVLRQRREAEAAGELANASAVEAMGAAEAKALQERMQAEAAGLQAKLDAMQAMKGAAKEHEEFRIEMAQREKIALARIELGATLATEQSKVLAEAFGKANIQIMGGDGQFFDRFVQGASLGNLIDGFLEHSDTAQAVIQPVLNGSAGVGDAIRGAIEAVRPTNGAGGANGAGGHQLPPRQVLQRMLANAEGEQREKIEALLAEADELGEVEGQDRGRHHAEGVADPVAGAGVGHAGPHQHPLSRSGRVLGRTGSAQGRHPSQGERLVLPGGARLAGLEVGIEGGVIVGGVELAVEAGRQQVASTVTVEGREGRHVRNGRLARRAGSRRQELAARRSGAAD